MKRKLNLLESKKKLMEAGNLTTNPGVYLLDEVFRDFADRLGGGVKFKSGVSEHGTGFDLDTSKLDINILDSDLRRLLGIREEVAGLGIHEVSGRPFLNLYSVAWHLDTNYKYVSLVLNFSMSTAVKDRGLSGSLANGMKGIASRLVRGMKSRAKVNDFTTSVTKIRIDFAL